MNLIYNIKDKPKFSEIILFALQQLLAIMAATIAVPSVVNEACGTALTASAALFGAGCGLLLFIFRFVRGGSSEWCSFAILLMNVVSHLIEKVTMPRSFGEVKKHE